MVADAAYATCLGIARRHSENFPVASRLLSSPLRPHVAAIYAFARIADDFADEGDRAADARLALLDDWGRRLRQAATGPVARDGSEAADVFTALRETIVSRRLDVRLFEDLLSAFRQDVLVTRYDTWDALLDYCRRSANPVGRLVLGVADYHDPALDRHSDALCTALQLTNFWQDLARDFLKGRVYVPRDLLTAAGADERDLQSGCLSAAWRSVLVDVAARTRRLFDEGRPVAGRVQGRLKWELRATWIGGRRVLDRLERADFDVFNHRPELTWRDAAVIGWRAVAWR